MEGWNSKVHAAMATCLKCFIIHYRLSYLASYLCCLLLRETHAPGRFFPHITHRNDCDTITSDIPKS